MDVELMVSGVRRVKKVLIDSLAAVLRDGGDGGLAEDLAGQLVRCTYIESALVELQPNRSH